MPRRTAVLAAAGRARSTPVTFSGPLNITSGGTYTGAWESTDPNVAAVTVSTTAAVTIQNSYTRSRGAHIVNGVNGINLIVQNCRAQGLNPGVAGRSPGRFVDVDQFVKMHILNNYLESTAGIYLLDFAGSSGDTNKVLILRNRARNIDGRRSTGAGFSTTVYDLRQFAQLDKVVSGGIEIAWNECTNIHNESRPEDVINIYKSSGFSSAKLRIHDNLVNGAFPINADTNDDFTGGGIITDGDDTAPGSAPQWVEIYDNTVIATTNYAHSNRLVSSGQIANGNSIAWPYATGTYVRNYHSIASWANNDSDDNTIGWYQHANAARNDTWFPDCKVGGCASNIALKPGQVITLADEAAELTLWNAKVATAGVTIGPSIPPP
jgi:hypothetical protein